MSVRQAGFTLVELLIALSLLSMIVVLLFGGIQLGSRSWDGSEARAERNTEMRMVWRLLHDHLAQAKPLFHADGDQGRALLFYGARDALEFVAPMPGYLGVGGDYVIRIQRARSRDGTALWFTRWLYHEEILEGEGAIPEWESLAGRASLMREGEPEDRAYYTRSLLVEGLEDIEIDYFGATAPGEEPDWSGDWEEESVLPSLVRMRLRDARGAWPEMIFALPN